jgi:hypothetical protein
MIPTLFELFEIHHILVDEFAESDVAHPAMESTDR